MAKPKLKIGDKIRIKKQVAIDGTGKYVLSEGDLLSVESVGVTGVIGSSKAFANGVQKKVQVSKAYYERA